MEWKKKKKYFWSVSLFFKQLNITISFTANSLILESEKCQHKAKERVIIPTKFNGHLFLLFFFYYFFFQRKKSNIIFSCFYVVRTIDLSFYFTFNENTLGPGCIVATLELRNRRLFPQLND
uniref:Uncharacterized protein n=1 Tax=Cacopsylla melanoneura TaxID=428564 RepID=A0A8D9FH73_9HEMI